MFKHEEWEPYTPLAGPIFRGGYQFPLGYSPHPLWTLDIPTQSPLWETYPSPLEITTPPDRMTDTCENITFRQLLFRAVMVIVIQDLIVISKVFC